jgi:large subunit ribosomal protein L22
MLSSAKLKECCLKSSINTSDLAGQLVRGGLDNKKAISALKNWQKGLFKPAPSREDIRRLASALSVEEKELLSWRSCCRYAPMSARKVRLLTQMINGRDVQDALDILKFTRKRAASIITKILKSAIADAEEQNADIENLIVSEARVDDAGIRIGTKRWIAKDRGRAHPIHKKACHVYVTVTEV